MTSSKPYNETMLGEHEETPNAKRALLVDSTGTAISATNKLPVEASIVVEDIEIGAVELKNATDDTRAVVRTDGTENALVVVQNTIPQAKVEIVTPLGVTCEDETNASVLVGVKGSVGYDNTNDVFKSITYGYDVDGSTPYAFSSILMDWTPIISWTERGIPILAQDDSFTNWYPLITDVNSGALNVGLMDNASKKIAFHTMDSGTDTFAWTENGLPVYTVSDSNYYISPLISDEASLGLLVGPVDTSGNKQVFTAAGEVKVENLTACDTGAVVIASGTITDITNAVAVTGTFWQATQPVSGTFWQATQPVSGTFWQATQPVSGSVTVSGTATTTGAASDALIGGVMSFGPDGTGADASVTLTDANTAYQLPAAGSVPDAPYLLILYNVSDTDMYGRFTTGTTVGWKIPTGKSMTINLGANDKVYAYCASAGKIMNVSTKEYF